MSNCKIITLDLHMCHCHGSPVFKLLGEGMVSGRPNLNVFVERW
ncbi:hypothetical protein SLEP1_g23000 [Rubroshorea leprosula]|uniref:Uncharacterized protein n=1 Tax=Rubroshorea leprosula TaxID=152421 RepID=A0AAV5JI99_9ROSI|nr:hypothetical protein SLEP1_g23000 [Rubroshorea leprosula]